MDIWFMYDGFSFLVLHWMENLGLVPRGEAGHYVDGGSRIRFDGKHPPIRTAVSSPRDGCMVTGTSSRRCSSCGAMLALGRPRASIRPSFRRSSRRAAPQASWYEIEEQTVMTNPVPNIQTKEGQAQLRQMGIRVIRSRTR